MGSLFKLQFWPGGSLHLTIGLFLTGIILFLATFFYTRNKIKYYRRIIKRLAIIGGFGLVVYLTPTTTLVSIYYRSHPEYVELYKKVIADPNNQKLREQFEKKRQEIFGQDHQQEN